MGASGSREPSMRCPACGFENASGIKLCGECGAPLKLKCSGCGFENAPGIKFCGEYGAPLKSKCANCGFVNAPGKGPPMRCADQRLLRRCYASR